MRVLKWLILIVILCGICVGGLFTYEGYRMYEEALEDKPLDEMVREVRSKKNFITFSELPKTYINAVIEVEDHRFYDHNGADIIAIIRAIVSNIKTKELREGGSTITQQLAKNTYFTQNRDINRKIAEIFMAWEIEKNYSKEEIFELYVNTSYFGDGYYTVRGASLWYFNKDPIDMTDYEATMLAGVPNAPSVYAPTQNLDLAQQRQKQVISKMVEYNYITQEEADEIIKEQLNE